MKKYLTFGDKSFSLMTLSIMFFFFASKLNLPRTISPADYLIPPKVLIHLSAGLKIQSGDLFWLRAIQDFDFCEEQVNELNKCKDQSWLFQIVDLATDFDNHFLEAYFYGGLALTIIVNDFDGASRIFDKGVAAFPKDRNIVYAAAYHALYEEKNKLKASKLYLMAADLGAPSWTRVLAGQLAKEGGDKEFGKLILEQMISTNQDPVLVERLKEKLQQVNQ